MAVNNASMRLSMANEQVAWMNKHIEKQSARIAALEAALRDVVESHTEATSKRRHGGTLPEDLPELEAALDELESVVAKAEEVLNVGLTEDAEACPAFAPKGGNDAKG